MSIVFKEQMDLFDQLNMPEKEWRDIKGYEGLYKISEYGEVKSLPRRINGRMTKERILRNVNGGGGYFKVLLYKNGKGRNYRPHRLVAEHFLEKPEGARVVKHKDGRKWNNYKGNLEWK